jgi:PQQ-like domain
MPRWYRSRVRHRDHGIAARLRIIAPASLLALAVAACTSTVTSSAPSPSESPSSATTSASASPFPATSPGGPPISVTWPAYHGDAARDGVSTSSSDVLGAALKVTASVKLDGAVYASPIVADDVVVVATENDSVYGLSPAGQQVWHVKVGTPSPAYQRPCGNIDPLGITGTPVYSAQTGDVYFVAEHGGSSVGHELWAVSLLTGKVAWHRSVDESGVLAAAMQQRGALTITGGKVWVSFGAEFGDCSDYKGRVIGASLDGTGGLTDIQPSANRQGGIWNPAGPTVDAAGHLYVVSANGSTSPGDSYDHTNSVLEYTSSGKLLSSFAPADWATNNEEDLGLGSQDAALVGAKWVVLGGKSGPVYVLRQGKLGGIGGEVSATNVCTSYGGAAVDGSVVYLPCTTGVAAVQVSSAGKLTVLWHAADDVAGSPVVGGGRVWSLDADAGVLYALDPATGGTQEHISVGETSRFATPALYSDLVIVPTLAGVVFVQE